MFSPIMKSSGIVISIREFAGKGERFLTLSSIFVSTFIDLFVDVTVTEAGVAVATSSERYT